MADAIASALNVVGNSSEPLPETLKRALAGQNLLLLLDNFEHVIAAAPLISELLASCPHLKILVTSRQSLRLSGEQEYPVPPLSLPEAERISVHHIAESEAATLFVQRAQMIHPRFEVSSDNAPAIARICARLDGMPLAIELAAARSKLLTPTALLEWLEMRRNETLFRALADGSRDAPPRQRTLRDSIEWSYNLLNVGEKMLFARLSVFRGGYSLDAVGAVCCEDLPVDVFDGMTSLVDKSLIQQKESAAGEPRFVMLETILEYATERLEESGEADRLRRCYAEYFVELAERAAPELRQAHQHYWFHLLEAEHENLRTVLRWSLEDGDKTLGARLVGALYLHWFAFGHHLEGWHWTLRLLKHLDSVPEIHHTKLLLAAGHMTMLYDLETARGYFERAVDISRKQGDVSGTAWSQIYLGYTMMRDAEASYAITGEGLAMMRELNHKPGIAQALNIIGELARVAGDDERATRAYDECLAISRETGETRRIRFMLSNLSFIAQHEGNYERARALAEQSLRLSLEMNNRLDIVDALASLAGVIGVMGQPQRASRLIGTWEAMMERMGAIPQPSNRPEFERNIATIRALLGEAVYDAHRAGGRTMTLAQAVDYALS